MQFCEQFPLLVSHSFISALDCNKHKRKKVHNYTNFITTLLSHQCRSGYQVIMSIHCSMSRCTSPLCLYNSGCNQKCLLYTHRYLERNLGIVLLKVPPGIIHKSLYTKPLCAQQINISSRIVITLINHLPKPVTITIRTV